MSQFQKGTVVVNNGNATVRHVWEVNYNNKTGSDFTVDQTIQWGGTPSIGVAVREDTTNNKLFFTHSSGPNPVVGDKIEDSGLTRSVDVVSFAAASPPNYDAGGGAGIAQGQTFIVLFEGVTYAVSSTINDDNFVLSSTYQEETTREASYAVVRDFSPFHSIATPELGDLDAITVVKDSILSIDTILKFLGFFEQTITSSGGTAAINWKVGAKAGLALTENVTTLTFTDPLGPAVVRLRVTQPASWTITWPASVKWSAGGTPNIAGMAAGEVGIIDFYFQGSTYYGDFRLGYT